MNFVLPKDNYHIYICRHKFIYLETITNKLLKITRRTRDNINIIGLIQQQPQNNLLFKPKKTN